MRKIYVIVSVVLVALMLSAVCYGDERGRGRGERHERGGFGIFIGPPLYYPYPGYPDCERVCHDRVVPVCRYDYWGDRWCHDEVVRDCRRVCY